MRRIAACACLSLLGLIAGCGSPQSPLVEKYRNQFLQPELEGRLISIKDAMALEGSASSEGGASVNDANSLADSNPTAETAPAEDTDLTASAAQAGPLLVAGKIYGGDVPAFDAEKASFTIIELQEPGHDHEDPGDCVFCKRRLESAEMAVVHLVDEKGDVLQLPADQLLGLQSGMNILAKGEVGLVGEMLVVRATELCLMDESRAKDVYAELNDAE